MNHSDTRKFLPAKRIVTMEDARTHIGAMVIYTAPGDSRREYGVIDRVSDLYVFVRYGGSKHAIATDPERLEYR